MSSGSYWPGPYKAILPNASAQKVPRESGNAKAARHIWVLKGSVAIEVSVVSREGNRVGQVLDCLVVATDIPHHLLGQTVTGFARLRMSVLS